MTPTPLDAKHKGCAMMSFGFGGDANTTEPEVFSQLKDGNLRPESMYHTFFVSLTLFYLNLYTHIC